MVLDTTGGVAPAITPETEELLRSRIDALAIERLDQIVAERVAAAMKKDPAKNKVAIIASKGTLDMAYPPLILASAAAAMGEEVEIFFTFYGLEMVKKGGIEHLKVAPVANPAMPVPIPNIIGMLPGMTPMATWMMKSQFFAKHNVVPLDQLLQECIDLGVKLTACQMSMDVMGIKREDLIDEVEIGGAATMLTFANEAHVTLFI
ncbi:MAG TPA: DsrE/DsrF/DrsH-like family protein [Ktedonobacterales bacterium]